MIPFVAMGEKYSRNGRKPLEYRKMLVGFSELGAEIAGFDVPKSSLRTTETKRGGFGLTKGPER